MNSFDNIIGYDNIKNELLQIVDMIKNEDTYKAMGAFIPSGVLIVGKPGLGKTTLAKDLIEECGLKSFFIHNDQMSAASAIITIKETFTEAAKVGKSIVFFDDIDKLSETKSDNSDDKVFVCIQSCIDEYKGNGILVIATANNSRKLPESLKRSGRFDYDILVECPSSVDSARIIEHYMKSKNVSKNVNFEDVYKMIDYESCANLETIINKSAIYAAYKRKEAIDIDDIIEAHFGDYSGFDREKDVGIDEREFYSVCLHEAGHALIGEYLHSGSVGFVGIEKENGEIGNCFTKFCHKFESLDEKALIGLAGKGACELFYSGYCAKGCKADLKKAIIDVANGIMDEGALGLGNLQVMYHVTESSDIYLAQLENLTRSEIEKYFFKVKEILLKNKDFLLEVAKELKAKGYLLNSDIKRIRESIGIVTVPPF